MIADILLLAIVGVNLFWGLKRGLMRNALRMVTTLVSLIIAFFLAKPVSLMLDSNWDLVEKITPWLNEHTGFLANFLKENTGKVALFLLTFVGLFILIRLILIIADRYIRKIKDSSKAIDILDRVLGFLSGIVVACVYLVCLFFAVDALSSVHIFENLPKWLQLTKDSGGFIAWRVYEFCLTNVLPVIKDMITGVTAWALEQSGINSGAVIGI